MISVGTWTGLEARELRRALRLSQRDFAAYLGVSDRIVPTWEKKLGNITPRAEVQAMLDTALANASNEAHERFQFALTHSDARRMHLTTSTHVESSSSAPTRHHPPEELRAITLVDAEQIELLAVELTAWDHARGGSLARIAAVSQARWATDLLKRPAPLAVSKAVARACAQLNLAAGFMAFDAQQHSEARTVFASALDCAREAGDPRLEAKAISHQARQSIWCGDAYGALALLDSALTLRGLSGCEQAMLHSARARAFAKLSRVQEALEAVASADRAFERHQSEDTPAWMTYYDFAQHQGDTGHALFDLAVNGREQNEALARLRTAADGHDSGHARSQAFSRAKLAALQFARAEPEEAFTVAIPAARQITALRSTRALDSLNEMARYAGPYRTFAEAGQLSELIRTESIGAAS